MTSRPENQVFDELALAIGRTWSMSKEDESVAEVTQLTI